MGFFDFLLRLLGLQPRQPPEPEEPSLDLGDEPVTKSRSDFDAPTAEITLYSRTKLVDKNGRISEEMAARHIAQALDDAGYNYEISYNYGAKIIRPKEKKIDEFRQWKARVFDETIEHVGKDANLLLMDYNGGGMSFVNGKVGIAPARHVDSLEDPHGIGYDSQARNIHAILHELGHQLGSQHDFDEKRYGQQHPGFAWIKNGRFHRTPNVAGDGAPNVCGQEIPDRENRPIARVQTYSRCFVENYLSVK